MGGVTFTHPLAGTFDIRLAPTSIEWTYNLNTATTQTYAGEVIQLLSVNIDTLTLTGQFGREGPFGSTTEDGSVQPRKPDAFRNINGGTGPYTKGLVQMTEYFRRYFAVASQGRDTTSQGHYNQTPLKLTYNGALNANPEGSWLVYPTSFPSYKRTNIDFAPMWQVDFAVEEPDPKLQTSVMDQQLEALRDSVGYIPSNVFSDPLGIYLDPRLNSPSDIAANIATAQQKALAFNNSLIDVYNQLTPAFTPDDLAAMIGGSGPYDPAAMVAKANGTAQPTTGQVTAPGTSTDTAANEPH